MICASGPTGAPLGSPEAALNMQDRILALMAQFNAEAVEIAQELRGCLPHKDPGRYLELSRRHGELLRWVESCRGHLA